MINGDLDRKVYLGIVEEINDPRRLGRVKVRVQTIFESIPTDHIPWARPYADLDGKSFEIPSIGKIVNVSFENGNIYSPYYLSPTTFNINLQDKLESLSDEEYKDFIAILFDQKTRLYSDNKNLTLEYLINKMTIDNESINLELKDNSQKITLGSKNADQRIILGEHFLLDWFMEFVKLLLNPANMMGNTGSPILKPQIDIHLNKFLKDVGKMVSSNVFVVDNNKVEKLERDSSTSGVEHDDVFFVLPTNDITKRKNLNPPY
jgi:hypothetical protein